jgi:TRAP-type C4-dicarboxylate transport system permease small subunit
MALFWDGLLPLALLKGSWRPLLLPPAVIIYILVIGPIVNRYENDVIASIRPIVLINNEQFDELVKSTSAIRRLNEIFVFVIGAGAGLWLSQFWLQDASTKLLSIYIPIALALMFGLLSWIIYGSVIRTRVTTQLFSQPLDIDIFDTSAFEPVGHHSLVLALVFIGGITISLLFGLDFENITNWKTWIVYLPLALVTVLIFFLNMRQTHRVLAQEKKQALSVVEKRLHSRLVEIRESISDNEGLKSAGEEFNLLVAYEDRLKEVRTWPYNTTMIRTLLISVLIPLLVDWILNNFF